MGQGQIIALLIKKGCWVTSGEISDELQVNRSNITLALRKIYRNGENHLKLERKVEHTPSTTFYWRISKCEQ